jgi:hypothetical protein
VKKFADIDWNVVRRYTSPQGVKDIDAFLDALPLNAGYNTLIAAGITWMIAGAAVVYTSVQMDSVSHLRAELAKVSALKPPIPVIKYDPVPETSLKEIQEKIKLTYKGIAFAGTARNLTLSATDTDYFPQFIAAIHTLQNGGKNWHVTITSMCAGIECSGSKLSAILKVEVASVGRAPIQDTGT